jgi:arginine utilization regulatory protein
MDLTLINHLNNGILIIKDQNIEYANIKAKEIFSNSFSRTVIQSIYDEDVIAVQGKYYKIQIIATELESSVFELIDITSILELKEKNSFLNTVLENINSSIILIDPNGNVLDYNKVAEDLEGFNKNQVIGKSLRAFSNTADSASGVKKVLETQKPIRDMIEHFQTTSGKDIMVVSNFIPVFNDSDFIGATIISMDYTTVQNLLNKTYNLHVQSNGSLWDNGTTYNFDNIIGKSEKMKQSLTESQSAAMIDTPILIVGETGTGKEMFIQSIHNASKRSAHPFVPINCAAIPENLLESLLFGTTKGSFTGAEDKAGLIEQAGKGMLYLDELNSMPLSLQAKLLRVIQEKKVKRLGGKNFKSVECRLIASVNESPDYCIKNNKLRQDLFYRLAGVIIEIPSLRDRNGDLNLLISSFINEFNNQYQKNVKSISKDLLSTFRNYGWPGNVRELRFVIEGTMCMLSHTEEITLNHLPSYIQRKFSSIENISQIKDLSSQTLNERLKELEERTVLTALKDNNGNVTKSADQLGISRENLYYRINKFKLKDKF